MVLSEALVRVQTAYPRIYMACHSRHQNARTTAHKLSPRDGSLIAHLDEEKPISQGELAKHIGIAKSTLSEAVAALEQTGYVQRAVQGRQVLLTRTRAGTQAMSQGSVLETDRLRRLLQALSGPERQRAIEGLELLANAGRKK